MGLLSTLLYFLIAISLLVVVHELGHYTAARLVGVKVLRFSVGFGRPIFKRTLGKEATEWVVAWLPIGGYVKMLDETEGAVAPEEAHRAFNRASLPRRCLIVLAGPVANLLLAVLLYAGLFLAGVEGLLPVAGEPVADSPAAAAGFRAGDTLLSVDDHPIHTWDERRLYVLSRALSHAPVVYRVRDPEGREVERVLDLSTLPLARLMAASPEKEAGLRPRLPPVEPLLDTVSAEGPGAAAGLHAGDRVLSVNDAPIADWEALAGQISASPGKPLRLRVARDGAELTLTATPEIIAREGVETGRLGIGVRPPPIPESARTRFVLAPVEAVTAAVEQTWLMSTLTVRLLGRMITLELSAKHISGPITIAQYAGESARFGIEAFVAFLAVVSVSLGVLNLMPVPVLDGGHLVYYLIEAVRGRPLSARSLEYAQRAGLAAILALMVLAVYNDLLRLLS